MSAVTWQQLLAAASTPDEVIAAARDFLAAIDHNELARLPEVCKPGKLLDAHDVSSYAYDLVRHHCQDEQDAAIAETIHKLSAFFSQAAVRVSQLSAPHPSSREIAKFFS
jgi:hypothetical protein